LNFPADVLLNQQYKKELTKIRLAAMNILAGREHSIAEIKTRLIKKNYSAEQVDIAVEELLNDGLLNEERFTESFIRSRIQKGQGPLKIRHELRMRGIADELIDNNLDMSFQFWRPYIERARKKRFGHRIPKDFKEQGKQSRFLYQRGFDGEQIKRCLC
jgi:regulatory protein